MQLEIYSTSKTRFEIRVGDHNTLTYILELGNSGWRLADSNNNPPPGLKTTFHATTVMAWPNALLRALTVLGYTQKD